MVKFKRLQDSDTGDYILYVNGLSFGEREAVIDFLENIEKKALENQKKKNASEPYPEQKPIGQEYIVPAGIYNGLTVENVHAQFGFQGLADIISAAPNFNGTENTLLHGVPLNYAINVCNEAILYYYNIVDEESFTDEKRIESYRPLLKLIGLDPDIDIEVIAEDPDKWAELRADTMEKFSSITRKFACDVATIMGLEDYVLELPEKWQNTNSTVMKMGTVFQKYGEPGLVSLMVSSINNGEREQVQKIVEYLKSVHKFKGFLNVEHLAQLYKCKNIPPEEIIPAIDKRLDKAVQEMEKQKMEKVCS